jgi:hypothetical protein
VSDELEQEGEVVGARIISGILGDDNAFAAASAEETTAEEATIEHAEGDAAQAPLSGTRGIDGPRGRFDFQHRWAEEAYEDIRANPRIEDVARTAAAEGFTPQDIEQVHSHLFLEEHLLDDVDPPVTARFVPSGWNAEAWMRLEQGAAHPSDFDLLRHELYESNYMRETGSQSYLAAHRAALAAGFWRDSYAPAEDGLGYYGQLPGWKMSSWDLS